MMNQGDLFEALQPLVETDSSNFEQQTPLIELWLNRLYQLGGLSALDVEFALFCYRLEIEQALVQGTLENKAKDNAQQLAVVCAFLSQHVGGGHICLNLKGWQWQRALSFEFYGQQDAQFAAYHKAMQAKLNHVDWLSVCLSSSLVAEQESKPLPLCLEGDRLYLMRHWFYESNVAQQLTRLAKPLALTSEQVQQHARVLDDLFAREYHFLFNALKKQAQLTQVERQRLICDMLDVLADKVPTLDWAAIDSLLLNAQQVKDLAELDRLIPTHCCLNWQKVAAAVALSRQFAVISGGPGTGKTTTVAKLLAALVSDAIAQGSDLTAKLPVIKLAAPTGKAAARLTESISGAIDNLAVSPQIKAAMTTHAATLHRLLGVRPDTVACHYHQQNPLHLDILVLDEASMVDLTMMHQLLNALPSHARLILLGDKDQLASVEAGAVLGDICAVNQQGYSQNARQQMALLTGFETDSFINHTAQAFAKTESKQSLVADSLCVLQKSYRFNAASGIGQLAKAINLGDRHRITQLWHSDFQDIAFYAADLEDNSLNYQALIQLACQEYKAYCQQLEKPSSRYLDAAAQDINLSEDAKQRAMLLKAKHTLTLFNQARVLAAIREGDYGVEGLNLAIAHKLRMSGLLSGKSDDFWYHGRPVMVSKNDASMQLNNGDIGICLWDESHLSCLESGDKKGQLRVYFEMPDGQIKGFLPSRMPEHETAFAMTVHKSQGSEFAHTIFALPTKMNPVLTRELIYTGVTRAKSKLSLFAPEGVLHHAVSVKTNRMSGLSDKI
ncbi:MAG: exodeoxyribonuclease V subunit alpha [Vibrio sp.]